MIKKFANKCPIELKVLLIRRGITQKDLANSVDLNFTMVNQFVNGWLSLRGEYVAIICKKLNLDLLAFKNGKIKEIKEPK